MRQFPNRAQLVDSHRLYPELFGRFTHCEQIETRARIARPLPLVISQQQASSKRSGKNGYGMGWVDVRSLYWSSNCRRLRTVATVGQRRAGAF